jgi:hypothetical protein
VLEALAVALKLELLLAEPDFAPVSEGVLVCVTVYVPAPGLGVTVATEALAVEEPEAHAVAVAVAVQDTAAVPVVVEKVLWQPATPAVHAAPLGDAEVEPVTVAHAEAEGHAEAVCVPLTVGVTEAPALPEDVAHSEGLTVTEDVCVTLAVALPASVHVPVPHAVGEAVAEVVGESVHEPVTVGDTVVVVEAVDVFDAVGEVVALVGAAWGRAAVAAELRRMINEHKGGAKYAR